MVLAQDLRNAVLQAALQGKLTEQLETDSSVDALLQGVKVEKKKLIDKGDIKRNKESYSIKKEDIPFEIPSTWKWTRMQDILDVRDGTHESPTYQISGVPFITSKNLIDGKIDFDNVKYISQEDADFFNKRSKVNKGDILMAMIGSIGKPVLVDSTKEFAIKNMALLKKVPNTDVNMNYVLLLLYYSEAIMKNQSLGGVQKFVSLFYLRKYIVPVPPIEEQQRIVDRVNELMEKIDEYEKVEKELVTLEQKFPNDMKNALLQAAMQGKLTKQLDSDSSVDEMLNAIKEEKKQLIKDKKIKKEKALLPIEEEDIPFDIPNSWKWIRLAQIGEIIGGGTPKTTESTYWENGSIPWITPADMNGCGMFIGKGNKSITREGLANSSAQLIPKNSIVISSRAPIGYISIAENELSTSQGCKTFSAYNKTKILSKYIYFVVIYSTSDLIKRATGTTFKEISAKGVGETIIPLPPIEEQKRIVERLEQLLPLCETL